MYVGTALILRHVAKCSCRERRRRSGLGVDKADRSLEPEDRHVFVSRVAREKYQQTEVDPRCVVSTTDEVVEPRRLAERILERAQAEGSPVLEIYEAELASLFGGAG